MEVTTELQKLIMLREGLKKKLEQIEDQIEEVNLKIDKELEEQVFATV